MSYAILILGGPGGEPTPHDGRYVVAWNSNVEYGTLALTSTADIAEARAFEGLAELMGEYSAVSRVQPRRPDGEPNRPLRALSFEIINLHDGSRS